MGSIACVILPFCQEAASDAPVQAPPKPEEPPKSNEPPKPMETPQSETKEEKRVRLKRERDEKKLVADERKKAKLAEQAQKKADARARRIQAGEDITAIDEEERQRKLASGGLEQKRRYSSILLTAQLPIQGVDGKSPEWMDFKDRMKLHLCAGQASIPV